MPLCEMCGSEEPRLKPVRVEGTRLQLCDRCAKFGVEVQEAARPRSRPTPARGRPPTRRRSPSRREPPAEPEYDLAEDYPDRIRRAREERGWKREDLATKVHEKLSVIEKLEKGKMRPDDALVAKLERTLGMRLMEKVEEAAPTGRSDRRPLTLGDLIRRED